jgi:hypothetical protein
VTVKKKQEIIIPRSIPPFFNPQKIGGELREVDVSLIQTEDERVVSRWFHGAHDADLFIWADERNNVIKQQVAFCGQIVEWNVLDGIRTGVVVEQEFSEGQMNSSETIYFDSKPQESAINIALDLIKHINSLDEKTREELLHQLKHRPSFFTMQPEEILRRYGTYSSDKVWKRFKDIFKKVFTQK